MALELLFSGFKTSATTCLATMAGARNVSVVMDETKKKNPEEPLRIIEKYIPSPGPGQALVRIFLRPVSSSSTDDEVRSIMTEVEIS